MLWLSAMLIAAVSNVDNLAAGVAFGMRGTRIAAVPNVVIAAVTMAATAGAITSGRVLARVLPPSLASVLGALIISAIGVWTVHASLRALRLPSGSRERGSGRLLGDQYVASGEAGGKDVVSVRQALALGVALAMNNVAAGVGAGVAGISPVATTLLAGALSLICLGGGSCGGVSLRRLVGAGWAALISGLILLALGATSLAGAG